MTVWMNQAEIPNNENDDDANGYIDDIHGWDFGQNIGEVFVYSQYNHCDYVLRAFRNVATDNNEYKNCQIMLLSVLDSEGECSMDNLIQAIKYADKSGAQICNLSLSTYRHYPELKEIMQNSDMLFVVAAGNDGENLDEGFPCYPVNYQLDNIISVAAIDENEELLDISNYGENYVDVAMNGIIKWNGEKIEGTSIATGKVTAVAMALYHQKKMKMTSVECKKKIVSLITQNKNLADKVRTGGYIREKHCR